MVQFANTHDLRSFAHVAMDLGTYALLNVLMLQCYDVLIPLTYELTNLRTYERKH